MKNQKGLILISHGSRVKKAATEMEQLVKEVQQSLSSYLVREAYMEIQKPDLKMTLESLLEEGVNNIDILPLFFFEGRHMRDDIPAQVRECQERFKNCQIKLLPHIGSTKSFVKALLDLVVIS